MAIKKSDLYSSLWASCDELRGGMDASQVASVKERIKEIGSDPDSSDELRVLKAWLKLSADETALKKAVRDRDTQLDQQAFDHDAQLSVAEIKALVIHDKWLARLGQDLQAELDRVSQALTRRIRELALRYEAPLPQLTSDVDDLSNKVGEHLKRMGVVWN